MILEDRDPRVRVRPGHQSLLDRLAGEVSRVDDSALAMSALPAERKRAIFEFRELDALPDEILDHCRATLDHVLHDLGPADPAARSDRVPYVGVETVAGVQDRSDAALRVVGVAVRDPLLRDQQDLEALREGEGDPQSRDATAHHEDVGRKGTRCEGPAHIERQPTPNPPHRRRPDRSPAPTNSSSPRPT